MTTYITASIVLLIVSLCARASAVGKNETRRRHLASWRIARQNRLQWKEANKNWYNFDDEEYQGLWLTEIGAEETLIIMAGNSLTDTSYSEYCLERQTCEN